MSQTGVAKVFPESSTRTTDSSIGPRATHGGDFGEISRAAGPVDHAPVILLARDPRDAFVSYYVQLTHRNHPAPESIKQLSADGLLHHPRFGIGGMVAVMNEWLENASNVLISVSCATKIFGRIRRASLEDC